MKIKLVSIKKKIFPLVLLLPLLVNAGINPYAKECQKEYKKESVDILKVKSTCTIAAKYAEDTKDYVNASWCYLLSHNNEYNLKTIQKTIDEKSKEIYSNIGHSYVLLSEFDEAKKMYEAYLFVGNNSNIYMQKDYKLLLKLYPEHKNQLEKGLALWDELYLPLSKIYKLMRYFQYSLKDDSHENYKETDKEKVDYLHETIRQQENKNYRVKKHLQQNTRLIMRMYIELYKIYKKNKDYTKKVYYFSKALEKMEIYYAKAPQKLMSEYDAIIKQYEKIEDFKNALKYAIKYLELREKTFGFENIPTIESYHDVSSLCTRCGEHKKSLKYYKKIVHYMETDLKTVDIKRADVYSHLAQLYVNAQDNTNAIKYYKKSLYTSGVDYEFLY